MRRGLYIRTKDIHPIVRKAVLRFGRWLRGQFQFPIRVVVYFSAREFIVTRNGSKVSASFFAPFELTVEPYIRIATGDYQDRKRKVGRDNALAAILCSFVHEVVHYQQWWNKEKFSEREATKQADKLLKLYAESIDHP